MNDELTPESPAPEPDEGPVTRPADLSGPDTSGPQSMFGPPGAGGMIRAARQAQGIDQASLAAMLKIPLRRIEALEQGRHHELQGATFERALAQAACRALKIDPKPVLALLPQHERNTLEGVSEGLNAPFRERQGGGPGAGGLSVLARPVVLVSIALVLAAAALLYVPAGVVGRWTHPIVASLTSDAPSEAASAPGTGTGTGTTTSTVALAPAASDATTTTPAPATPALVPVPVPAPESDVGSAGVATGTPSAAPVDEVLAHPTVAPSIPVQVIATTDSWVEVLDAQGHPLLSRTVVAGESVGLDGALPMRVKVGNARGTRLTLRGDNVDLAPWTRDNVARRAQK